MRALTHTSQVFNTPTRAELERQASKKGEAGGRKSKRQHREKVKSTHR